jgi:hypothetical protein
MSDARSTSTIRGGHSNLNFPSQSQANYFAHSTPYTSKQNQMPVNAFPQETQRDKMKYFEPEPLSKRENHFFSNVASEYPRWSNGFQNAENYEPPSESRDRNPGFRKANNNFAEIKQSAYPSEERAQNQNYFDKYQNPTCQSTLDLSSHTHDRCTEFCKSES